jgi:Neuraminidase-like domain/Salmonella virulence plasmid 28.1kDa A protein
MVSLANKYSSESGIPAEFYYALFRAGLSTNADELYQTNSETLKKIWNKAIDENLIAATLKSAIDQELAKFKEVSKMHLLENAQPVGVSSFKDLLSISLLDSSRQQEFTELYFNHTGDISSFWAKIEAKFGKDLAEKLQVDGKLSYLTMNNAKLVSKFYANNLIQESPSDLVKKGLYKRESWDALLNDEQVPIPRDMPGETNEEKKKNYINYMVSLLKVSYPTLVVAEMVNNDSLRVKGTSDTKNAVYKFLLDTHDKYQIGIQPLEKILKEEIDIKPGEEALKELKRLGRVYQISPSDNAMKVLWDNNLDSALAVVQYDEEAFTGKFGDDLGGQDIAKMVYAKAHQVHSTVLNIAVSCLTYGISPKIYAISSVGNNEARVDSALIDYPTMEELFGSMDYCTCEHCKSVLSPATYLIDLLQFINLKKYDSAGNELPTSYEKENPVDVLLKRRPDIEHIQLTCENTNTILPYIDLVNEILEYYVVNDKLEGFEGYNVEDNVATEELLANPQFVNWQAYEILKNQIYPFNLPFNQPLEALRLFYDYSKVKLQEALEKLRIDDNLDTTASAGQPSTYAWREIYNEFLGISPEEYKVLTDSATKTLPVYFGEDQNMAFDSFNDKLSNAKVFSRRTGITYNELIGIIKTQFINSDNSHLIPKLQKLRISFDDIKKFKEGNLPETDFESKVPSDLDRSIYGGDIKKWVKDNYDKIMNLILLTAPLGAELEIEYCKFDKLELRYSLPDSAHNRLKEIDYWRLLRFIRLWKKLGWSIEETDKVMAALYKSQFKPAAADDIDTQKRKLDSGFKNLLVKVAHVKRIKEKLDLKKKDGSLVKLLALWSNIDTHGNNSLYNKMFLHSSILKTDRVFEENGYGEYLRDPNQKIAGHLSALQAAFNVTGEELALILKDADFDDNSVLALENVSRIYRYCFLARALKLSIQEFVRLKSMSGINPFHELEDVHPSTLRFIELRQLIQQQSNFNNITTLSYLLQHEDIVGKGLPSKNAILSLAKTLKDGLVRIEQEHKVENDPTGEIAKSKMALVYENAVVDKFFGLLKGTASYSVDYTHPQAELEEELIKISNKIAYDHFQKRLTYHGMMTEQIKNNFKNAPSASNGFKDSIQKLYDYAQEEFVDFFDKYPDLKVLYENYLTSNKPNENERMSDILEDFMPSLKRKLKDLFIKQTLTSSLNIDLTILNVLLDKQNVLHSIEDQDKAAIEDFLRLELSGIYAEYFFSDNISTTQPPDKKELVLAGINFDKNRSGAQLLPANPANTNARISAVWNFYLEVPVNGDYNCYIETDKGADVKISIDEKEIPISDNQGNGVWQNQVSLELETGRLYQVRLEITKVKDKAILKWESKSIAKESVPLKYLYPYELVQYFYQTYIRSLKAIDISKRLGLKEKEIAFFSNTLSFQIDSKGFLNSIPVLPNPDENKVVTLFNKLIDLLFRYIQLKTSLNVKDEILATILADPNVKDEKNSDFMLIKITGWNKSSLTEVLQRFKWMQADLSDLKKFLRVYEVLEVQKKFGIPANVLFRCTTNQPTSSEVSDMQNALRAKYEDESIWLNALQPISDQLRSRQRDALVSYVLHKMQNNPSTKHIDTSDKLFEYFLIDIETAPCTKTSRIKQAISTVQLFIQRCLMNLEPEISPASIKANQWEWMKRYRVWEANRKIFLYPENLLHPELRDNKSSFFRDLEGELLQADITDELAETALLNYLEKLDDVSKLDICGMFLQENELGNKMDDILHVFGRTIGASRKYYYRRFEYGYWTPWEKVDLDIEDNPISPVVWKNRLFLFWLNIVKKGSDANPFPDGNKTPAQLSNDDLNNAGKKENIEINLSWSEYYNNRWQPRKTSDFDKPAKFPNVEQGRFKRENVRMGSWFHHSGLLIIWVYIYDLYKPVEGTPPYGVSGLFGLFNKHGVPLVNPDTEPEDGDGFTRPIAFRAFWNFDEFKNKLAIRYEFDDSSKSFTHEVLKKVSSAYDFIEYPHLIHNPFEAPFFYRDGKHVFFVDPDEDQVMVVGDYEYFGRYVPDMVVREEPIFPDIYMKPAIELNQPRMDEEEMPERRDELVRPAVGPSEIDAWEKSFFVDKLISENRVVTFGDAKIGPMGSLERYRYYDKRLGMKNFGGSNTRGT